MSSDPYSNQNQGSRQDQPVAQHIIQPDYDGIRPQRIPTNPPLYRHSDDGAIRSQEDGSHLANRHEELEPNDGLCRAGNIPRYQERHLIQNTQHADGSFSSTEETARRLQGG